MTREEFFAAKNKGALWDVGVSINRTNPLPLDKNAVFESYDDALTYAKGVLAYPGQFIAVVGEDAVVGYLITVAGSESATLVKLAQTSGSGDVNEQLTALTTKVNNIVIEIGKASTDTTEATGLYKLIEANKDAIDTLNGDGVGSVSKAVSDAVSALVDGAPETFDTLKEIATWISEHGKEATTMTTAIAKLEGIVDGIGGEGEEATVVAYVTSAINALKNGDIKTAQDNLTALTGRVDGYDTKLSELETAIGVVQTTANAAVVANTAITGGTATKITYDAKGLVTKGENLAIADIPNLPISSITNLEDTLKGKQDTVLFDQDNYSATNKAATVSTVNTAVGGVITNGADKSTDDTVKGAKLYADSKASTAEQNAKDYADTLVGDSSAIAGRVTVLEGKVDVAKVSAAISDAKTAAVSEAGTAADTKVAAAKTAILGAADYGQTVKSAYDLAATKTTMAAVEAKGYAVKTDVDTAVATAKAAGDNAQTAVDNLAAKVGTVPDNKTIVQMISDAQTAATYDDTAVKADIKKNADAIGVLNGSGVGSVKKTVDDAINKFATDVSDDNVVNSYKELIDWVATHGSEAAEMADAITALQAIVDGIGDEGEKATVIAYVNDAIATLNIDDYAKSADVESTYVKKSGTDRLMTAAEGTKLSGIAADAQVNTIESIKVNGAAQAIAADKSVDIAVPVADGSSVEITENKIGVKAVDVQKLFVAEGDVLILNGGNATDD